MRLLVETVEQVAGCNEATLIQGETGTGKELVARLVHRLSPQRNKKMVNVNCAAIPADLAESQLFGHLRGAFTGATADREGLFEAANGRNALSWTRSASSSQACQAKMLRALQFGEFERLGSTKTIHVTVRVLAATNRKLAEEVAKGTFRGDLYHRLNILPLEIPPLRERAGEIVPLALRATKGDQCAAANTPPDFERRAASPGAACIGRVTSGSWTPPLRQIRSFRVGNGAAARRTS